MRFLLLPVFLFTQFFIALLTPAPTLAANCQFTLGFKTLHGLAPSAVGDCLADVHYSRNGDGLQPTTKGLLVWRKADNFTAFTDGFHSWINGPLGLQERLNSQRFSWEHQIAPSALADATYQLPLLENLPPTRFTLANGEVTLPVRLGTIRFLDSTLAYGDLNNDGMQDSSFVLVYNGGGTGQFEYLVTVVNENGTAKQVGTDFLGDRVRVNRITVSDHQVTVAMLVSGPTGAACCPTVPEVKTFQISVP